MIAIKPVNIAARTGWTHVSLVRALPKVAHRTQTFRYTCSVFYILHDWN